MEVTLKLDLGHIRIYQGEYYVGTIYQKTEDESATAVIHPKPYDDDVNFWKNYSFRGKIPEKLAVALLELFQKN